MASKITAEDRAITRAPATSRIFTRWTPDDLEIAEALTVGGSLWRAADLCWALLGDGRVRAALETRVKGLLRLPLSWDEAGDRRSSGRVARTLEGGDWYAAHSEAALCSLAMWGVLLGVGLNQRVWELTPDGRWVGVHRPYDVRNLRWDTLRRVWVVRTATGEVDILPGDRRWVLYAPSCSGDPDGDERPWMYGAWRACDAPWLIKHLALGDFGHHMQMHGSAIRTADYDAALAQAAPSKDLRDKLNDALADLGADASIIPPPGMKLRLMEAVGKTWEMFPAATQMVATEIVIAITGQSSSTEVVQGQDTGATLHGIVRQDLIEGDAQTLSTCLRDQDLTDYAEINFGGAELAPWPRWKTDPPANIGARGEAMKKLGDGIAALDPFAPEGQRINRAKIFEDAGIPLEDAPKLPPVLPAPLPKLPPAPPAGHRHTHGHHRAGRDARAETNVPATDATLPFWRYNVVRDDRGPCTICEDYDGVVLRAERAWWSTHTPPLHFNCRCFLSAHADASGGETAARALDALPAPDDGFGDGRVPLDEEGLRVEHIILALAVILGIALLAFGRPPRDGGTGRAYNPKLPDPGANDPGRWIELGAGVTMPSGASWPAWDDATEEERIEATLAFQRALYDGAEDEDAALASALESHTLSPGARHILESMRAGARFTVPTEEK